MKFMQIQTPLRFGSQSQESEGESEGTFDVSPRSNWTIFGPGLFFVLLGVVTVLWPKFILGVIAAFFVVVGGLLSFIAYKFLKLKRSLEEAASKFQGSIQVQRMSVQTPFDIEEDDSADDDTIIIH